MNGIGSVAAGAPQSNGFVSSATMKHCRRNGRKCRDCARRNSPAMPFSLNSASSLSLAIGFFAEITAGHYQRAFRFIVKEDGAMECTAASCPGILNPAQLPVRCLMFLLCQRSNTMGAWGEESSLISAFEAEQCFFISSIVAAITAKGLAGRCLRIT